MNKDIIKEKWFQILMIPIITVFSYVIGRPDKEFTKLSFAERMNHYYKQVDEGLK